jgi:hypothetical protein
VTPRQADADVPADDAARTRDPVDDHRSRKRHGGAAAGAPAAGAERRVRVDPLDERAAALLGARAVAAAVRGEYDPAAAAARFGVAGWHGAPVGRCVSCPPLSLSVCVCIVPVVCHDLRWRGRPDCPRDRYGSEIGPPHPGTRTHGARRGQTGAGDAACAGRRRAARHAVPRAQTRRGRKHLRGAAYVGRAAGGGDGQEAALTAPAAVERRDPADGATMRWMLFVQGPPEVRRRRAGASGSWGADGRRAQEPDIGAVVRRVVVHLHPSFAPDDVVELPTPPFHVARRCAPRRRRRRRRRRADAAPAAGASSLRACSCTLRTASPSRPTFSTRLRCACPASVRAARR